jgi:hypothetical protein
MKKILLGVVILALVLFSAIVPIFGEQQIRGVTTEIIGNLSAIASFLTLLIAVLLFNRFGIEQTLLDKQTAAVFALVDAIVGLDFQAKKNNASMFFRVRKDITEKVFFKRDIGFDILNTKMLFNVERLQDLDKVEKAVQNPFMPKDIVKAFKPLEIHILMGLDKGGDPRDYVLIGIGFNSTMEVKKCMLVSDGTMTFGEYLERWEQFVGSIETWLRENSSVKIELNM